MKTYRKYLPILAGALGLMLGLGGAEAKAGCTNTAGPNFGRIDSKELVIIAHRGLWGEVKGGGGAPENSSAALQNAITQCMQGIEIDVKMTSDGHAVAIHDYNLGRTTNIWQVASSCKGQAKYNPLNNQGCNPTVNSITLLQFENLSLLTQNRQSLSGYFGQSIAAMLARHAQAYNSGGAPGVLIFDIKTADAVRAVYGDSRATFQTYKLGFGYQPGAKVNATLYGTPAAYHADAPDDSYLKPIPVFTTNMLNVINVDNAIDAWDPYPEEVNVKSVNGFLQGELNHLKSLGTPVGVFQAIPDGPDGPGAGSFYNNNGSCCYTLASLYTTVNGVKEKADNRGNAAYLKSQGFTFITTDDPYGLAAAW